MALDIARLRRMREDKGWSQAELSRRAGINQSHYCHIERGYTGQGDKTRDVSPSADAVTKIAAALGVDPLDLTADAATVAHINAALADDEIVELER